MILAERMAYRAIGSTAPNPPVGAIIVKDEMILARGWTQVNGSPHAEIHAISQVKDKKKLNGATLYTTLEPCSHYGKNPPCVEKIIKYKFAKVYLSQEDENPKVHGSAVKILKRSGITVIKKNFSINTYELNKIFFRSLNKCKPYVTLKIASTSDGKIATKSFESKWITNSISRLHGHKLRAKNDCILVGSGTISKDNPLLNCRLAGHENSNTDIFLLDQRLKFKKKLKIFSLKKRRIFIFYNKNNIIKKKIKSATYIGVKVKNNLLDIADMLKKIAELGYMRVLVEGGSVLTGSLIKNDFIDEIQWFRANKIIGGNGLEAISSIGINKINDVKRFKLIKNKIFEDDQLSIYKRI